MEETCNARVQKLSVKDMKSTDGKVGYSNPGCFHRHLTAFHYVDSFTSFNSYTIPAPGSFEFEFFHYFVAFSSELFSLQYTYFPGLDHFPEAKITNQSISAEQVNALKNGYENTLKIMYEKYAQYKEAISEYDSLTDEKIVEEIQETEAKAEAEGEVLPPSALETSGLELLITCFNHILVRIFVARTFKDQDLAASLGSRMANYAEALLAATSFKEQVAVFKHFELEPIPTLPKKNIFDMNVFAYIEAKMKNIPDDEAFKLLGSSPLYMPATISDIFFDLVVYVYNVITRPEYTDALVQMNEQFVSEIPEIKKAQAEIARANLKLYEEFKKQGEVDLEDEEFTKSLNPPATNLNTDNALKWFMSKTANEYDNGHVDDDPYMRHNTYNIIRRMIEEILANYGEK